MKPLFSLLLSVLLSGTALALELNLEYDFVRHGECNFLKVRNNSATPDKRTFKIRLKSGEKEIPMPDQTLVLEKDQTGNIALPVPDKFGIYTVVVEPTGDKEWCRKFAYLPVRTTVEPKDSDFQFGVNLRFHRNLGKDDMEKHVMMAQQCGVTLVRHSACAWDLEKEPGEYDFSTKDEDFKLLKKYRLKTMLILFGWSKWSEAKNWKPLSPEQGRKHNRLPDGDGFARFSALVAARYGGDTPFFEIGNEPDLIFFANYSLDDYLTLLKKANAAIKKVCPEAKVMNGGIAKVDNDADYFENFLKRAGRTDYDIVAFHHHSIHKRSPLIFNQVKSLMKANGIDKPVFPNECGFPACATERGEQEQAELVWKKILYSQAQKSVGYIWYNMRDNRDHRPEHPEGSFGLIARDFQPKPAYAAYYALTNYFTGAKFVKTLREPQTGEFYLFRAANGDWLIPFWTDDQEANTRYLISGVKSPAFLADFYGNETPVAVFNGFVSVQPGVEPQLLRIPASETEPSLMGELLEFSSELFVYRNKPLDFSVTLRNPFRKTWKGELRMAASPFLSVAPETIPFELKAGENGTFSCRMTVKTGKEHNAENKGFLTVDLRSSELQVEQLRYSVRTATIVGRTFEKEPLYRLNGKDQVLQLFPSAPEFQHMVWSSPEDLSAETWIAADDKYLNLRIDVRDDVHKQTFPANELWKGDSIQLGFAVPKQKGFWELGFAFGNDGKLRTFCWSSPKGFTSDEALKEILCTVVRDETRKMTRYDISIRRRALGLTPNAGKEGVCFNMVLNDCDENSRENLMRLSDGLGTTKEPRLWQVFGF